MPFCVREDALHPNRMLVRLNRQLDKADMPSVYIFAHLQDRTKDKPAITIRQSADMIQQTSTPLHWAPFTALCPLNNRLVQAHVGVSDPDHLAPDSRGLFWSRDDAEKTLEASVEATVVKMVRSWEEVDLRWPSDMSEKGVGVLARTTALGEDVRHWWEIVEVIVL